jgi:7-carboxy-7-deazaguanine synthase
MTKPTEEVEAETGTPERTTLYNGEATTTTEGTDVTLKPVRVKKHPVIELFGPVIQGEGVQAGLQTMFIRFGGCDFRCDKCDSLHAVIPEAIQKHATYMTPDEIIAQLLEVKDSTDVEWVTLSGGNPCMHKLDELVLALNKNGFKINVETQGSMWQDWLDMCHMVTVSPKPPGMGEALNEGDLTYFLQKLGARPMCIKMPVFFEADLEVVLRVQDIVDNVLGQYDHLAALYLSLGNPFPPTLNRDLDLVMSEPEEGIASYLLRQYRRMSEEILLDPRLKRWRFLPQLHVLVYGNEAGR